METQHQQHNTLGWIALAIAIIGLIIGVLAYVYALNPTSVTPTSVKNTIVTTTQDIAMETKQQLTLLDARIRVAGIRARLETKDQAEQARVELSQVREELSATFSQAKVDAREQWLTADARFGQIEQALRNTSANSIAQIRSLLVQLETELRFDEDNR